MELLEKLQSAEQNLFESDQKLKSIAQLFPDPIFIIDKSGKFLLITAANISLVNICMTFSQKKRRMRLCRQYLRP
jgi:signal transduction histidine kinase